MTKAKAKSAGKNPGAKPAAKKATDFSSILPWYESSLRPDKGKALERVRQILPAIAEAELAGAWPPKLSRTARAVLSKQPVAEAFARANARERSHVGARASDAGKTWAMSAVRWLMRPSSGVGSSSSR